MKQIILFYLLLILCSFTVESTITFENETTIYTGNIVNAYPALNGLWDSLVDQKISGVAQQFGCSSRFHHINCYNVSNYIFIDDNSINYLYSGGHEISLDLQEKGVKAFFVKDDSLQPGRVFVFEKDPGALKVPVASIGRETWVNLMENMKKGNNITFSFTIDSSTWYSLLPYMFVCHVVWICLAGVPLVVSSTKLIQFIRESPETTLALVCLGINCLGDILLLFDSISDPYFFYPLDIFASPVILPSTNNALMSIVTLLIVCYWVETLRPLSGKVKDFISFLFWPFVSVSILFASYTLVVIIIIFSIRKDYYFIGLFISAGINFFLGILFFVVGFQVIQSIPAENKKWMHLATKIIIAAVIMLFAAVTSFFLAIYNLTVQWDNPAFNLVLINLRYIEFVGLSITLSLLFQPRSSSSSSKQSSKPDTKT